MKLSQYPLLAMPVVCIIRMFRFLVGSICLKIKTKIFALFWRLKCGRRVKFIGSTIIRTYDKHSIIIGDGVTFNSCGASNLVGLLGPTILCANAGARIEIGNKSGFSSVVINARSMIKIGSCVKVGGNVRIFDHDFHPVDWQDRRPPENSQKIRTNPVIIDDDVFIGTSAIILKGTHVGARSIIAAGSVVFGLDIPPDSIVKGNPAVIINR